MFLSQDDTDGDGFGDACDGCPENPNTANPGLCDMSSSIEDCIPGIGINCIEKLVINLVVTYDADDNIQSINLVDSDGEIFDVPVDIQAIPSEALVLYPLSYVHEVPYYPFEEVIKVENTLVGLQECVDNPIEPGPHCGWVLDDNNVQIPDSQGFCCNKGLELLDTPELWRGEALLGQQSTSLNSFSTAHCYRSGELTFSGLEIQPQAVMPSIDIQVTIGPNTEIFTLSPINPLFDSPTGLNMGAEMTVLYTIPDFSTKILYYPTSPVGDPMVEDWEAYTMIVPPQEVTVDGSECDKVGVDYSAFRAQLDSCDSTIAGDCLHNQLYHKFEADSLVLSSDPQADTTYLMSNLKNNHEALRVSGDNLELVSVSMKQYIVQIEIDKNEIVVGVADSDGDGYTSDVDCDDTDPSINPGANEVCDGVDNDCDGEVDEGIDDDGDGISDCVDNCPDDYNPDQADNDGGDWKKKRPIELSGSSVGLTDYQVKIIVDYDPDMQTDYDDLRFFDDVGGSLDYWIQEFNADNATVWVEVQSIPVSGATIYMHYANPTAESTATSTASFRAVFMESNRLFEMDSAGTSFDAISLWDHDSGINDSAWDQGVLPSTSPYYEKLEIATNRRVSGQKSIRSLVDNNNTNSDRGSRHWFYNEDGYKFVTYMNSLYIWTTHMGSDTNRYPYVDENWAWAYGAMVSDGEDEMSVLFAEWVWYSPGDPSNYYNDYYTSTTTGADGSQWKGYQIPLTPEFDKMNLDIQFRHYHDTWGGQAGNSLLYFDGLAYI